MTIYQPTIALDTNKDTYLDSEKNIAMFFSVDSVSQTVSNAISLWKNEYQFNTTKGTPWLNILGQQSNRLLLNSYIETSVLSVQYVTSIISIDYIQDNQERIQSVSVRYNNIDKIVGVANANI